MKPRFAVLGWGSLIWDLEILTPHVELPWKMHAGPTLPMEFSRVSPKRKMALAVCLDENFGDPCPTHAVLSRRSQIEPVIQDLAARERAPIEMIGGVCLSSGYQQGRGSVAGLVRAWCAENGWQGAVWTDLRSNYSETRATEFSVSDAIGYLRTLAGEQLDEAVRYITLAPAGTDTPLRRALELEDWWRAERARLGLEQETPIT